MSPLALFTSIIAKNNSRYHQHHMDDENGISIHQHGNSTTSTSHHHHHHHHPHHIHHHHHSHRHAERTNHNHPPSRASAPQIRTPHCPTLLINNNPTLEAVRDLPRRHLGSALYSAIPPSSVSQGPYDSSSTSGIPSYKIPRCEGKENHTLTIRIPRFYLSKEERERICLDRAVWGTEVYSDDSDPLAAAIHAGWIRGEWGDNVDLSMLELNPSNELDTKKNVFTSVPPSPMLPLPGKDLHLILLILPCLQNYASRVAHGVKSRAWGNDHDGVSYRIEQMTWVDQKADQGEKRVAESRHKRMKTPAEYHSMPPLRLGMGTTLGKTMVATAAA